MHEVLAIPRRHIVNIPTFINFKFKNGLPINAIPGWETVPLTSKLPMLRFPNSNVIFTINKIGNQVNYFESPEEAPIKRDFELKVFEKVPEYNPLTDANLKNYYNNPNFLERLRENGEITADNDVICDLPTFNAYRRDLHKTQLYYVLQEINHIETGLNDGMLITNAETITERDYMDLDVRRKSRTDIRVRKKRLEDAKAIRNQLINERTQMRFDRIHAIRDMKKMLVLAKRELTEVNERHHREMRHEADRKQIIALKKVLQLKWERLERNLIALEENRQKKVSKDEVDSWQRRLDERRMQGERLATLLDIEAEKRRIFVENHRSKYEEKWREIRLAIRKRSRGLNKFMRQQMRRIRRQNRREERRHRAERSSSPAVETSGGEGREEQRSICMEFSESFENLLDDDLCQVLEAVFEMDANLKVPFNTDDPIYKAAEFIRKHVIAKFNKDMSEDKKTYARTVERLQLFLEQVKKFVVFRATQIIASTRSTIANKVKLDGPPIVSCMNIPAKGRLGSFEKFVSFNKFESTIGVSSYQIHPFAEVRTVKERPPTPAGSLASIVVDSQQTLIDRTKMDNLCRNDIIFVEHYISKFKREVLVGIGKRVFLAIDCHFQKQVMKVNKNLLDLDEKFIVDQAAKAILSFAINPLNYESIVKLIISVISSNIIHSLQKYLLKSKEQDEEDEAEKPVVQPMQGCMCKKQPLRLCHYCYYG